MKFYISKTFQGGYNNFRVIVSGDIYKSQFGSNPKSLLEWVGENTGGGHNYGYRVTMGGFDRRKKYTTMKVAYTSVKLLRANYE